MRLLPSLVYIYVHVGVSRVFKPVFWCHDTSYGVDEIFLYVRYLSCTNALKLLLIKST